MRIDQLLLDGFGRFRDADIRLGTGLNILFGGNEAGKSTLHEFIRAMLFGFSKPGLKRSRMMESYGAYRPWAGSVYRGRLLVTLDDGRRFRVERDFDRYTARLFDDRSGAQQPFSFDGRSEPTFAAEWLRLSQSEFTATVCIGQLFTSALESDDARELAARMAALQSTGREDESTNRALAWLDERLTRDVGTFRAKVRSPLGIAQGELEQVAADLKRAKLLRTENLARELRVRELASEVARIRQEQTRVSEAIQRAESQALLSRVERVERRLTSIEEQEGAAERVAQTLRALAPFGRLEPGEAERVPAYFAEYQRIQGESERAASNLARQRAEVERLQDELSRTGISGDPMELEARLDALQSEVDRLKYHAQAGRTDAGGDSSRLLLWAAAAAVLLLALVLGVLVHPAGLLAGLVAIPLIWMALRSGPRPAGPGPGADYESRSAELKRFVEAHGGGGTADVRARIRRFTALKAQWEAAAGALAEAEASGASGQGSVEVRQRLLQPFSLVAEADEGFAAAVATHRITPESVHLLVRFADQYRTAGQQRERALETVEQIWVQVADEIAELVAARSDLETDLLEGLRERALEPLLRRLQVVREKMGPVLAGEAGGLEALKQKQTALAAQLQERVAEQAELQGMIRKAYEDLPDLAELERRHQTIQERIDGLLLQQRALERAKKVISRVAAELHRDFAPRLAHRVAPIVRAVTAGRYTDVRVDEELSLTTEVPETRQLRSVGDLSLGTLDQFYFALRIGAALELTADGERPFLLCDDSLVQYDDRRAEACLRYLAQLAGEHQIILLTCHSREAQLGQAVGAHVIHLGEPVHP